MKYIIILFYKYVRIEDPLALMAEQRELCLRLGLKGRMIIAHEGINATFEGTAEGIEEYCRNLQSDPRFADTDIKKSDGTADGAAFPRLSIKVRKEIVSLGLPAEKDIDPRKVTGKYLKAEQLHEWFQEKAKGEKIKSEKSLRDFVIIDMRNDYEHVVGHFKDSILPPLQNFRDLPKVLPQLESLKNKTVVTVCTGGVRCEKASGYLIEKGFTDVYQLEGGIVTYMEKFENSGGKDSEEKKSEKIEKIAKSAKIDRTKIATAPAGNFVGSLYVFDERETMAFAPKEKREIIGKCAVCSSPSERYVNCANNLCHKHFIICGDCAKASAYCSDCKAR